MKRILFLTVLVIITTQRMSGQAGGPPAQSSARTGPAGSWSISGTMVSAAAGTPLDRTTVTLSTPGVNGSQIAEMITGEDGVFRFDGLAAGKYELEASRRGYIAGGYQDHGGYFTAIVTGPNLDSQNLRFELTPFGTLGGTVTDENGGPVSGARVGLFRQDQLSGDGRIVAAGQEITDDSGSYEFANLQAGTYYVDASATPWYAVNSMSNVGDGDDSQSASRPPPSPLDVAYPITFYPNATDSASATPIPVNLGEHVQINFSLHAVPAVHLEVRVPSTGNIRRGVVAPQVSQDVFGTQEYADMPAMLMNRRDNVMVFSYDVVASGHYMIQQGSQAPVSIDASSSRIIDLPSATTAAVDVSGKFAMASGAPLPDHTFVSLRPLAGQATHLSASIGRDGNFRLSSVSAGSYDVLVSGSSGTLVVAQMAASNAEVHGSRITVGTDPVLLAATLARGSVTVNGFARRDGKGIGGTMVVLVPADPHAGTELFRRDQSDSDGSFTLNDVVPGNYVLVSIENGWTLDWAMHEVIAPYLVHGLKVQVPENQRTLNLSDAVAVQER